MKLLSMIALIFLLSIPIKIYADDNRSSQTATLQSNHLCKNNQLIPYKKHYIRIISENDAYVDSYSDRYYTAGNRIGYSSKEYDYYCQNIKYHEDPQKIMRSKLWWLSKISLFSTPNVTKFNLSISQEIYTPSVRSPVINNYPYAGYSYLSLGFTNRGMDNEEVMKLDLGLVGPDSLGQFTQNKIHTYFGFGGRLNWENQLSNEPIVNLYYQVTKRYYIFDTAYISSDFLHSMNTALGNAHIYVATTGRLRLGHNLNTDFGVSKINHSVDSSTPYSNKFSFYIFIGATGKVVVKNIFISGNTFQAGNNLEMHRFIYELEAGLAISFYGVRLSYIMNHRSSEFLRQEYSMNFGSIALDLAF